MRLVTHLRRSRQRRNVPREQHVKHLHVRRPIVCRQQYASPVAAGADEHAHHLLVARPACDSRSELVKYGEQRCNERFEPLQVWRGMAVGWGGGGGQSVPSNG